MKLKLELDDKGLRKGFVDFQNANKVAVKNTLNIAAALTRRNAVAEVKKDFTLRNTWTVRNIQFDKATGTDIRKMKSRVGATERASYMATQEKGGRRPRRGRVTSIPQRKARMGDSLSKPVTRAKYISRIKPRIVSGAHAKAQPSHRAYGVAQMAVAFKKKLFLKRNDNIYWVASFETRNGRVRAQLEHLYHITAKSLMIKKETWLEPSIRRPVENFSKIYRGQLRKLWKYDAFK